MKQFMGGTDRLICLGGVYVCAAVVLWQTTPIIGNAFVQALAPVFPLVSLVFFSLMLLYLVIVMILSIVWMIGEVCDRHRYFKARQAYREMQLEQCRLRVPRSSRYRHTDANLYSVRQRVFYRRVN
jgi:5-bromo-4-chloroindolyl phosphate hydrolysis protein